LATSDFKHAPAADEPTSLQQKISLIAGRLADARRLAEQAQVREAVTRNSLTLALVEALSARAEGEARLRRLAFDAYRQAALRRESRPRRRSGLVDRLLGGLRAPGQALLIARSGLWRPSGPGPARKLHDLRHMAAYARRGPNPAVAPSALLDQAWYLSTLGEAPSRLSPLAHYLLSGWERGRAPHPLFDPAYYAARNAGALAGWRASPLEHFVRLGAPRGFDPHPLFSLAWYVAQRPELAQSGANPLAHYLEEGWGQGLSPHPLFDPHWYLSQAPRSAASGPPLVHYLAEGWRQGLSPHPLFDPAWYLTHYPDVARTGDEPLSHFAAAGGREGRDPGPWFDTAHYAAARGDALGADANPLVDYLLGGAWRVSEARPGFATAAYLAARPEAAGSGLTPLDHWARLAGRG
jgi:hypothetical protein